MDSCKLNSIMPRDFIDSVNLPMPNLEQMAKLADQFCCQVDMASGADQAWLAHPDNLPGIRTAMGITAQLDVARVGLEKFDRLMRAQMRVIADPYCPLTLPRQFRFPRSKKKRIRNKWAKDRRNWREEKVVFIVDTGALRLSSVERGYDFSKGEVGEYVGKIKKESE
jgi:hypothetical protein